MLWRKHTPTFHYSITPFFSDHSARAQGDEIVIAHTEFAAINFLVVLADQWCRARDPARRLTESWNRTEMQVFADDRMFHIDECFAGFYLGAVHELPYGVDGRNSDTPLLAFLVKLFFSVAASKIL